MDLWQALLTIYLTSSLYIKRTGQRTYLELLVLCCFFHETFRFFEKFQITRIEGYCQKKLKPRALELEDFLKIFFQNFEKLKLELYIKEPPKTGGFLHLWLVPWPNNLFKYFQTRLIKSLTPIKKPERVTL